MAKDSGMPSWDILRLQSWSHLEPSYSNLLEHLGPCWGPLGFLLAPQDTLLFEIIKLAWNSTRNPQKPQVNPEKAMWVLGGMSLCSTAFASVLQVVGEEYQKNTPSPNVAECFFPNWLGRLMSSGGVPRILENNPSPNVAKICFRPFRVI